MGWLKSIRNEIKVIRERDPAIHSDMEVFLYPSFKVMIHYRVAHKLYQKKHYFLARWISQRAVRKTGIEIHPGAKIGENFFIDHGNGVIIGETAIVGNNVTLYQGVTLGGTGKDTGKRHPTICNDVVIGAGAKVLGNIMIGTGSRIGAGSVVIDSVPEYTTVVGIPGRIVQQKMIVDGQLLHNRIPDPITCQLNRLKYEIVDLKNEIAELKEIKKDDK